MAPVAEGVGVGGLTTAVGFGAAGAAVGVATAAVGAAAALVGTAGGAVGLGAGAAVRLACGAAAVQALTRKARPIVLAPAMRKNVRRSTPNLASRAIHSIPHPR